MNESLPGVPPTAPDCRRRSSPAQGQCHRPQLREHRPGRVGFVGEPDLDVLGVAVDADHQDRFACDWLLRVPPPWRGRQGPRRAAVSRRRARGDQSPTSAGRATPVRDQVDAPVQSCDTTRPGVPRREPGHRLIRRPTERHVLLARRLPLCDDVGRRRRPSKSSDPRSTPSASVPAQSGAARSWRPSTSRRCVPLTMATSTPGAPSSRSHCVRRSRARFRSTTAVPSQWNVRASNRAGGHARLGSRRRT